MNCIICNSENVKKTEFSFGEEYSHHLKSVKDTRELCYCSECNFGYYKKYIGENDLLKIYLNEYREHEIYMIGKGDPFHRYAYDSRHIEQILLAKKYHEFVENENFLDVGPGQGVSFWTAVNLLPKLNLFAVELGLQSIRFLEKLNVHVYKNLFLKIKDEIPDDFFNFILMSHSLEHFNSQDLDVILRTLYKILRSNGVIVIEVPFCEIPQQHNIDSDKFYPDPTHLSFFSPKSIKYLFEIHGFKVEFLKLGGMEYKKYLELIINKKSEKTIKRNKFKGAFMELMPSKVKNILHKVKAFKNNQDLFSILKDDAFNYGANRSIIRLVVTKSDNR